MKRKQISITENQEQKLKAEAKRTGLSEAELYRRALDAYLDDRNISHVSIKAYMDQVSRRAAERGLTPEDLETLLNE